MVEPHPYRAKTRKAVASGSVTAAVATTAPAIAAAIAVTTPAGIT